MEITFKNKKGLKLSGILDRVESPAIQAIYAHCFTCSKNHPASYRICKSLAKHGIQTLRFDFSGLGKSEGQFNKTNFTDYIDDIRAAINYLKENESTPRLLIGHSLGGITAVAAACEIEEIGAVATIAAPSRPSHVLEHFKQHLPRILEEGAADVSIFDRTYTLTKNYIENLQSYDNRNFIKKMNKPILIFHSPFDNIVSVDEAAKIFTSAKHPKSFISLDSTDHLVSNKNDAQYIAQQISCWARRYLSDT